MTDFLAAALEYDNFLKVPVAVDVLKQSLRDGLPSQQAREYWWAVLPELDQTGGVHKVVEYPDAPGAAERLHALLNEPLLDSTTQAILQEGSDVVTVDSITRNVLFVLNSTKKLDATNNEFFDPLVRLLVSQFKRADLSYYVAVNLLSNKEKYIDPSPDGCSVMFFSFREMCDEFMPKTYKVLLGMGALDDRYLRLMFTGFFVELLPNMLVLQIVDAFLNEGVKILFRYALALLKGYKQSIKGNKFNSAQDFWLSVKADAIAVCHDGAGMSPASTNSIGFAAEESPPVMLSRQLGMADTLPSVDTFLVYRFSKNKAFLQGGLLRGFAFDDAGDRSAIDKFRRRMPISSVKINNLKVAAGEKGVAVGNDGSRKVSNGDSRKASVFIENWSIEISGDHPPAVKASSARVLQRHGSLTMMAGDASSASAKNIFARNLAGSQRSGSSSSSAGSSGAGFIEASTTSSGQGSLRLPASTYPNEIGAKEQLVSSLVSQSSLLNSTTANILGGYLPSGVLGDGLQLSFSTQHHGWDINTMYHRCRNMSPSLLVVSLMAPYKDVTLCGFINTPFVSLSVGSSNAAYADEGVPRGDPRKVVGDPQSFVCRLHSGNDQDSSKYVCREALMMGGFIADNTSFTAAQDKEDLSEVMKNIGVVGVGGSEDSGVKEAAVRQFCIAAPTHLCFGASSAFGCNALRLSSDLKKVRTGFSDTYDNPPLLRPTGASIPSSSSDFEFEVADVDVFCGSLACAKAEKAGQFRGKESIVGTLSMLQQQAEDI